jgi:hypothetical protein
MSRSVEETDRGQGPGTRSSKSECSRFSVFWPLRSVLLFSLCVPAFLSAQAPIFPDQIGTYQKKSPTTLSAPDRPLYDEYGLEAIEQAIYVEGGDSAKEGSAKKQFTATGWRMHDSTGAMALFEARKPSGATPAKFAPLSVTTSDGVIFQYGNYVFQFTDGRPDNADLNRFYNQLPKFENSPLPLLATALPQDGLVANSERYLLGPVSLQRFAPEIPPSTAAFRYGSEAQLGKYQTSKGLMTLVIFDYPTPNMAREQTVDFEKIPKAAVKRAGPLVAIVLDAADPDAAERLLGKITYQAQVTENEKVPVNEIKGFAGQLISMFILAGIVILLCILAGVGYAGFRLLRRKISKGNDPDAMITLSIDRRSSS